MRKVKIIAVGSKRLGFVDDGLITYEQKIKRYCSFEFQTIKEASYSKGKKDQWLAQESERIEKAFTPGSYKIVCDEHGKLLTSKELAKKMQRTGNEGISSLDFIVGGAFGLSPQIRQSADLVLSFSPMTFPHQMFRLFLAEQIFRAFTIINGEKYHH